MTDSTSTSAAIDDESGDLFDEAEFPETDADSGFDPQTEASAGHYVYLYRSVSGRPRYVGYGATPSRALGHRGGSHNAGLESFLAGGAYTLEIAGPYGSRVEGLHVETALISALRPDLNDDQGDRTRFRPVGVPADLADRVAAEPLDEQQIGVLTGGALIVYLAAGDFMADGRPKANPADPDVEVIATDAEKWWQIDRHMDLWRHDPAERPRVLVAVYGPKPTARFIIGAFEIDGENLGNDRGDDRDGAYWQVPLLDRGDADARGLRGRRLARIAFGQGGHRIYHWVDGSGDLRWDGR